MSFLILGIAYIAFRQYLKRHKTPPTRVLEEGLNQKEEAFNRISKWILHEKRYLEPDIKLDKVARGVHLSEKQVSTAINTIACQNFNTYINRLRIKEAQAMLMDSAYGHYTIDAVAEMVGFSNKVSFYKAFKKVTGKSPTDFRKSTNQYH